MSAAYKCDLCGKLYERVVLPGGKDTFERALIINITEALTYISNDMCPRCLFDGLIAYSKLLPI